VYLQLTVLNISISSLCNTQTFTLTHRAEPFLKSRQMCSHSRTSQHFMKPEGLLPCSQNPPLVPILSQINPIHPIPYYLSKINFKHLDLNINYRRNNTANSFSSPNIYFNLIESHTSQLCNFLCSRLRCILFKEINKYIHK
jgi:hypothetical protein